jgi:multicomponent Na+:H+ antiporter subunit C
VSLSMIFAVAGLVAAGTFLVTSRSLSRIVLGFALLGHAAVIALLASGGRAGSPPIVDGEPAADTSNPLPQALSLTAIVISFGLTLFVLALARRQQLLTGDDLVEDDVEDRRIATTQEAREAAVDETLELEALHDDPEGGS